MSTPIEIMRDHQRWRTGEGRYSTKEDGSFPPLPHTPEQIGIALDAVLREAERFQALERAFKRHGHEGGIQVRPYSALLQEYVLYVGTLAELADKLRSEK
jgi:hypothetical protein